METLPNTTNKKGQLPRGNNHARIRMQIWSNKTALKGQDNPAGVSRRFTTYPFWRKSTRWGSSFEEIGRLNKIGYECSIQVGLNEE